MQLPLVVLAAAVPTVVGVLVLLRRTRPVIGWLLVAHGVSVLVLLGFTGPTTSKIGLVADQLTSGAWVLLFLWLALVGYLVPDGRTANLFWRWWVRIGLVGVLIFLVGAAGDRQGFADAHHGAALALPWLPSALSGVLGLLGLVLTAALFLGSVAAVWYRLRHASGDERLQLLWLVWGSVTVPLTLLAGWVNYFLLGNGPLFPAALAVVAVGLPLAVGGAILRHHLFDIQLVLSRTLTYLLLIAAMIAVYALLLFATQRLTGHDSAGGLLAVGVVAVAVQPAYAFLRARTERWVYGLRSDPRAAIRLLANRADAADPQDPDGLLAAVTEAIADVLRVGSVWVEPASHRRSGPASALRTPMVHRGALVGQLAIEVPPGRELSRPDRNLLADLARYTAILVRSEELNSDLRDSRRAIVAGREEERLRIRRDLHDGVGPSLAAIVLKLNASQARTDPGERNALLAETRDEVKATIVEVRRLVDDLRPPAIDEVGLMGAIRQRAGSLSASVTFEVEGPDPFPLLPAAVEVAAFRIASEAMTNVVRHSGASRCRVGIAVDDSCELIVTDNGRGLAPVSVRGVGWTSMCERAAELGGRCVISDRPDGGLVVHAVLPLGANRREGGLVDADT